MIQFPKAIKFLLISGLLSVAFVAGYYMLNDQIKKKNREAAMIISGIDSALLIDQQLRGVQNLIRDTESDREKLNSYFVSREGIVDFLEVIEGLEQYTGAEVSIKTIGENDTGEFENIEQLELNLTAEGSWEAVYHFFVLLESLPYRIDMSRVQFNNISKRERGEDIEEDTKDEWRGIFILAAAKIK